MGSLLHIKRRIKSAKNISQITKAMEMVSASKMKKAQDQALRARPFTEKLEEMIQNATSQLSDYSHPLIKDVVSEKNIALIVVSTNKGLCGGLNVNLFREITKWADIKGSSLSYKLITLGKKAKTTIPEKDSNLMARFNEISETPAFEETRAVAQLVIGEFMKGEIDSAYVVYPKFISTLRHEVLIKRLLPVQKMEIDDRGTSEKEANAKYLVEPSPREILDNLIVYQIEASLYHIVLEARASEHSARMVAMKNASDNAKELIGSLTLDYNSARQSQVTNELLDVTSARKALED